MTRYKIKIIFGVIIIAAFLSVTIRVIISKKQAGSAKATVIQPAIGDVILTVTTTGIVEPQNRLEIKPSIGGRIEEILVEEGDRVSR